MPEEGPPRWEAVGALWILRNEYTVRLLIQCHGAGQCTSVPEPSAPGVLGVKTDMPVAGLTWPQAVEVCEPLGGRLPSEAEWEWAARGSDDRVWPWGHSLRCPVPQAGRDLFDGAALAHLRGACAHLVGRLADGLDERTFEWRGGELLAFSAEELEQLCRSAPVGIPAADLAPWLRARIAARARARLAEGLVEDPLGDCGPASAVAVGYLRGEGPAALLGMGGNVAEWVRDAPAGHPERRVIKGGSWASDPWQWRVAARASLPADQAAGDVGLRCVWAGP